MSCSLCNLQRNHLADAAQVYHLCPPKGKQYQPTIHPGPPELHLGLLRCSEPESWELRLEIIVPLKSLYYGLQMITPVISELPSGL